MFETYINGWASMVAAYFSAAASLLAGNIDALSVTAAAGIVLFAAGVLIALIKRVSRTLRLVVPGILTALWPILVIFIEATIDWLGRILISFFGVGALLIWVGLIVGKAPDKLPIWLIGLGLASFVAFFGLETLVPLLL